ncbi:MAG: exopolysaccharide biosynthesis protein, partial [Xanthomonadales bacterium]|nr:exopolysaccharide biosynthesis protein [Xanthomonadales bacterium]
VWQSLLKPCSTLAHWLGRFSKPRLGHWIDGPAGLRRVGALLLVGGLLLAIPAPMIPFSNTIPVLGILCTYTALLERDGALLVVAIGFMALSALYFALLGWLALTVGFQLGAWLGLT